MRADGHPVKQACGADSQACGQEPLSGTCARAGSSPAHDLTTSHSERLTCSRQYPPHVRVSCRLTRERELGSDARLPHIEPYILFVIPLERPSGVRSSSTPRLHRPMHLCPALPHLAELCYPPQHTHAICPHTGTLGILVLSTLCLRAQSPVRTPQCRQSWTSSKTPPPAPHLEKK